MLLFPSVGSAGVPSVLQARAGISVLALVALQSHGDAPEEHLSYRVDAEFQSPSFSRELRRQGVELVRLVTNPLPLLQADDEDRLKAIVQILEVADSFVASGLAVVVDLHFWSPNGDATRKKIFLERPLREAFKRGVGELAFQLAGTHEAQVALELLNEPPPCNDVGYDWTQLQVSLVADIRRFASSLPIVVTGCGGQLDGLLQLRGIDFGDPNLMYSFHFYEPFAYTHQSAFYGVPGYLVPYPPDKQFSLSAALPSSDQIDPKRSRYAKNDIARYLNSSFSKDSIAERLSAVAKWADLRRIPRRRIFMGEWGAVIGPVPRDEGPRKSELRWLTDVKNSLSSLDFKHAFWLFPRQTSYDYDPEKRWLRDDVADAIGLVRQDRYR
ncbi:cellulase family glycosylhydrolase [Bradyrhizobium sp. 24]|nr:cellulase family glycosylhydrolase [Bradyrhizobium sp. 24]